MSTITGYLYNREKFTKLCQPCGSMLSSLHHQMKTTTQTATGTKVNQCELLFVQRCVYFNYLYIFCRFFLYLNIGKWESGSTLKKTLMKNTLEQIIQINRRNGAHINSFWYHRLFVQVGSQCFWQKKESRCVQKKSEKLFETVQ